MNKISLISHNQGGRCTNIWQYDYDYTGSQILNIKAAQIETGW